MRKILVSSAILFGMAIAGNAMAIPAVGNLAIDFRSDAWSGANNQDTWTVAAVTAEALPNDTFPDYKLSQDSTDGLGVQWSLCFWQDQDPDEIENPESLLVTGNFEANGVWITDLFGPDDGSDPDNGEVGSVTINGLWTYYFNGIDADQVNGEIWVNFGSTVTITSALFQAVGYTYEKQGFFGTYTKTSYDNNEFSVAGFTNYQTPDPHSNPVPEPATMLLLGAGLAGLTGSRLRKKKK